MFLSLVVVRLVIFSSRVAKLTNLEKAIKIASSMQEIRIAYNKSCFRGFVGPQKAGKSTLLNRLYGFEATAGSRDNTKDLTIYHVGSDNRFYRLKVELRSTMSLEVFPGDCMVVVGWGGHTRGPQNIFFLVSNVFPEEFVL